MMGVKKPSTKAPTKEEIQETNTLLGLTETLNQKIKKMDDQYKDIPTPVNFAKLETDVKHHGQIIYGTFFALLAVLITVLVALVGGYFYFDNKITNTSDKITLEIKDLRGSHSNFEENMNREAKTINRRIDSIIIPQNPSLNNNTNQAIENLEKIN